MYDPNKLDAAYFDQAQREKRVKRLFYNDFPEQRGDTPPTATQWVDEMAMAQRKIGTPGLAFWREGPMQIFQRFYYLAREAGLTDTKKVADKDLSFAPYNPTQRAQDSQKVATAVKAGQIAASLFPEEFKVHYDGAKSIDRINKLLDVQDVFEKRDPAQVKAAVDQLSQLAGNDQQRFPQVQPGQPGGPAQ
jgi:hypothetical protein